MKLIDRERERADRAESPAGVGAVECSGAKIRLPNVATIFAPSTNEAPAQGRPLRNARNKGNAGQHCRKAAVARTDVRA